MNKPAIRKQLLQIRRNMPIDKVYEKSNLIFDTLCSMPKIQNARIISCYISFADEVQTKQIIDYLLHAKKTVCIPTVVDTKKRIMKAKKIIGIENNEYILGENIEENMIDACIIPGIGFDIQNNRIGFGFGYYDRFLKKCVNSFKIGICFNEQKINNLPIDENDIKMDCVISY